MPANLPPQYVEAEKVYREAKTPQEKIEALEAMLAIMPKHKGTDHLKGELRARIARLTDEATRKSSGGRAQFGFVRKEGAGQALLVGPTSAGKSRLVGALTEAEPRVGDYPFTTQEPFPAMMPFENVQVQLVDLPALAEDGLPPWMRALARQADLLLLVVDLSIDPLSELQLVLNSLEAARVLLGPGQEGDMENLITRRNMMVIANKLDLPDSSENLDILRQEFGERVRIVGVSALSGTGLDDLPREVFAGLGVVRVYTKPPGKPADFTKPVVLPRGSTVADFADQIHRDIKSQMKYAVLWGSGRFSGQRVSRAHVLADGDIVELVA